jgi:hypothetical protein
MRLRSSVLASVLLAGVLAGCGLGGHPPGAIECSEETPEDNETFLTADPTDPPCTLVGTVVSGGNDWFLVTPSIGGSISIACPTTASQVRVFIERVSESSANALDCGGPGAVVDDELPAGSYGVRVATSSVTALDYAVDLIVT